MTESKGLLFLSLRLAHGTEALLDIVRRVTTELEDDNWEVFLCGARDNDDGEGIGAALCGMSAMVVFVTSAPPRGAVCGGVPAILYELRYASEHRTKLVPMLMDDGACWPPRFVDDKLMDLLNDVADTSTKRIDCKHEWNVTSIANRISQSVPRQAPVIPVVVSRCISSGEGCAQAKEVAVQPRRIAAGAKGVSFAVVGSCIIAVAAYAIASVKQESCSQPVMPVTYRGRGPCSNVPQGHRLPVGGVCIPQCKMGFTPLPSSLLCQSDGTLFPHSFTCARRGHLGEEVRLAAQRGDADAVLVFIDSRADVNAQDDRGRSALYWAATLGHSEILLALAQAQGDLEAGPRQGDTAIREAARYGHIKSLRILLEARADVDARPSDGDAAIHKASQHGHVGALRVLLEARSDAEARARHRDTAVHKAAEHGHTEAVDLLFAAAVDLDARDVDGKTALHYAAAYNHAATVRALVTARANVKSQSSIGRTAFDLAELARNWDVAALLRGVMQ